MNLHLRMFLMLVVLTLPACSGGGSGDNNSATESEDSTELTPEEIEYEKNLNNQK